MHLTIDIIRENFRRFNNDYFEGRLKEPLFGLKNMKRLLGQCYSDKIVITSYYDLSERFFQNILLHEMIHWYIRNNSKLCELDSHGRNFTCIAARINREGGWNIKRTDSVRGVGLTEETKRTWNACSFRTNDGRYFLFLMHRNYVNTCTEIIKNNKFLFRDPVFVTTDDDKLCGSMTECRTRIRGIYVTAEKYDEFTKTA